MSDSKFAEKQIYRVIIKAPIETVWSELVKTAAPRPFFWNSSWDTPGMRPGAPFRMVSQKAEMVAVVGEFLEMEPPHLLSHTFRLTSLDDPPSKVTYRLKETPEGTEFSLITENIIAGSKSVKSMDGGARYIVRTMKTFMENGRLGFGDRLMLGLYDLMAPMAPKAMRKDNWPLQPDS